MTLYYILPAVSALFGIPLCSEKCGKWGKIVYCVLFGALFVFVSAVRFQVGYDYNLYGGVYQNLLYCDLDDVSINRMEKGFLLPLYVFNLGFEKYYRVFIITSIINYYAVFYLIYKFSPKPWISVCAFICFGIFFNSLCFLRQFIAALTVAYAMKYACKKNYLLFLIWVISASAFHWSALLMAALYFFLNIKPSWKYLGIMTAGTIIFCLFSRSLMKVFIENFFMYRGYDPDSNPEASIGLSPRYTIIFGILLLLCYVFKKRIIEKNPHNAVYINCMMFTVIFESMGTRHAILSRFALLTCIPAVIFLLPDTISAMGDYFAEKKK